MRNRVWAWILLPGSLISMICLRSALYIHISQADPNHSFPPLPKYLGGSEVQVLLGIKNKNLDPV